MVRIYKHYFMKTSITCLYECEYARKNLYLLVFKVDLFLLIVVNVTN
ncbi:hypothetical protein XBKB1_2040014 [Xenorhabdus bovienii str. kraussei Becker Underwood]|uniref:Uncharacterized protein n=1 Tax=Xenorhabdus bovienii str. kraussei Becker Underwood TaxID=1398204 RepID=A0A077PT80_XENBV|nr:hypothetical protein XBKB1_2040014 [Xenorhabdus bovienii str. kraussei Becker Underwood]